MAPRRRLSWPSVDPPVPERPSPMGEFTFAAMRPSSVDVQYGQIARVDLPSIARLGWARARKEEPTINVRRTQSGFGRRPDTGTCRAGLSRSTRGAQTEAGSEAHARFDQEAPGRHRRSIAISRQIAGAPPPPRTARSTR